MTMIERAVASPSGSRGRSNAVLRAERRRVLPLEFILSSKVILVEGDAEYILIDAIYSNVTGSSLEADDVHVISVGGTSFKRYLDLAMLHNCKISRI